jgi:hypothetical protein
VLARSLPGDVQCRWGLRHHFAPPAALYFLMREYEEATGRATRGALEDLLYLFRVQAAVITV